MEPTRNTPVYTPPLVVRATAAVGFASGALAFVWAMVLIVGAFLGRTVSPQAMRGGFILFLGVCFIFTVVSALIDDVYKSRERRAEVDRLQHGSGSSMPQHAEETRAARA